MAGMGFETAFEPLRTVRNLKSGHSGRDGARSEKPQAPSDDWGSQFTHSRFTSFRTSKNASLFQPTIRTRIPGYGLENYGDAFAAGGACANSFAISF